MRIAFSDGTTFQCPNMANPPVHTVQGTREWKVITVIGTHEVVKAAFVDGAQYQQEWDSVRYLTAEEAETTEHEVDENGLPYVVEMHSKDLSEYCVAGDVIDTRDGNITVYMGKKTQMEIQQEAIDELLLMLLEG